MLVTFYGKMLLQCSLILGLIIQAQGQFTYVLGLVDNDPNTYYKGRLEISYNGVNGTVCSDHFDDIDARVVCRQLGLQGGIAVLNGTFGPGTGPIWLDDVECTGNERFLWECVHRFNSSNCNHNQDVGVICDATNTSNPIVNPPLPNCTTSEDIRLVGPSAYIGIGFVEIRRNGVWGAVCDDNWGTLNAQVVCRMLCYNSSVAYAGTAVNINYVISLVSRIFLADDVDCIGTETDITQCPQSNTGVHNCDPNRWEFASVTCRDIDQQRAISPSPSLMCSNVTMRASFKQSLDIDRNITSVSLSGGTCDALQIIVTPTTQEIIIPLYDCGTLRYTNQSHIFYTNTVIVEYTRVTFCAVTDMCYNHYVIEITCEYARYLNASHGFTVLTESVTHRAPGAFEIEMHFYSNAFVTQLVPPIELICGTWLWVDLHLITTDVELKLIVPRCYATPYFHTQPNGINCSLFEDKCEVDPTLTFHPLSPTRFGFAYTTYKFINYTSVVIHCDAWVCLKSEKNEDCDRSCWSSPTGRRKREAFTRPTYSITSQPITVFSDGIDDVYGYRDGVLVNLGSSNKATTPPLSDGNDNPEIPPGSNFDRPVFGGIGGQLTFRSKAVSLTAQYAFLISILLVIPCL